MVRRKKLTPSLEDYLEAILQLERKNRVARVKDIASSLSVQMPSVTGALKNLKEKGLVNYEKNSYISLTDRGMEIAEVIQNRHTVLTDFLSKGILLDPDTAEEQACEIEHIIDGETAKRLKALTQFLTGKIIPDLGEKTWTSVLTSPKE